MAALQLVGQLDGIQVGGRFALDREHLQLALVEGLEEFLAIVPIPYILCLHLGAHGNAEGVELSRGEFVSWAELRDLLTPVCTRTSGMLLLSMASCEGLAANRAAMTLWGEEDLPFILMVGSRGKPTWSETAIGYSTLYHHLQAGRSLDQAVEAMKTASGHDDFVWTDARVVRQEFRQRAFLAWAQEYKRRLEAGGQAQAGAAEQAAQQTTE